MKSYLFIEASEQGVHPVTKQIAAWIKNISPDLRGPLVGIAIGSHLEGNESFLNKYFDELMMVEVSSGNECNNEVISRILLDIVREEGPGIVFLGFTHQGMELGPVLGWRLKVPVITNCVDFDWKDGQAYIKRPIQRGELFVSLTLNLERGAVITVPKGVWKESEVSDEDRSTVLVKYLAWKKDWEPEKSKVIGITEEGLDGGEDITKSDILVSIGRGLGDVENLPMMKELAGKLGGMISCSRPVVDRGWLPSSRQVGISGKTVSPVIYLALGISGQGNHVAGMDASRIIIAVNKDPRAPIFSTAHYGIIDDILQFVPELVEKIKQRKPF